MTINCWECGSENVALRERLVALHPISRVKHDGTVVYFERAEPTHTSWDTSSTISFRQQVIRFMVVCLDCDREFSLPDSVRKAEEG